MTQYSEFCVVTKAGSGGDTSENDDDEEDVYYLILNNQLNSDNKLYLLRCPPLCKKNCKYDSCITRTGVVTQ